MKKYLYLILAVCSAAMVSCISDDSDYGIFNGGDASKALSIELGGLEEYYDILSFSGEELVLTPTVSTSFDESDMEYTWMYWDVLKVASTTYTSDDSKFNVDTISVGNSKDLAYTVNLPDGQYAFQLLARSKSTGYAQTIRTTVRTSSALSKGFYVQKETADGNTELDLYNTNYNTLTANILKATQGQAMSGKPRMMDVIHQQAYIDPETDAQTGGNLICITTENNEVQWFRTMDGAKIFTPENVHYEYVANEVPYRTVRGYWETYYITSNGVYSAYTASMGGSGVLGAFDGTGGSTHVVSSPAGYYGIIYWSNQTSSFEVSDYNAAYAPVASAVPDYDTQGIDYEPITCGTCLASGEILFFLMKSKSDASKKALFFFENGFFGASLTEVRELAADAPFANATLYAVNTNQATIAYYIKDNKLFAYDLAGMADDKELPVEGIGSGEQISYLSCQTISGLDEADNFNYLIIGTQTGDTYKVYMYEMRAGEPVGSPKVSFSGTGRLHRIDYVNPNVSDMSSASQRCATDR